MKKNISKILIYMFTILSIPFFAYYPTSNAKYLREEKNALVYDINIKQMNIGQIETIINNSSNYLTASYKVEFNRSDLMTPNDQEQLIKIIVEQPTCKIDSVVTSSSPIKNINNNEAVLKYNTSSTNGEKITVSYSCNVESIIDSNNFVATSIKIYEKNQEEVNYHEYANSFFKIEKTAYYNIHPIPSSGISISDDKKTLILPNTITEKYDEVKNWLNIYSQEYGLTQSRVETYFKTVFNNDNDLINTSNFNKLKGLTISYNPTNQEYTFILDDNFSGYLKTYYSFVESSNYYMYYFTDTNMTDQESNDILNNYLNLYKTYTTYNEEQIQNILLYINSYGSVKQLVNKEVNVPGITAYNNSYIRFDQNILNYVESFLDARIKLKFGNASSMWMTFKSSIQTKYDFVSDELNSTISSDTNLLYSIIKNNTSSTPVAYSDYFKYYDETNKNYVMLNVESSGAYSEENPTGGNTYVELVQLGNATDLNLITEVSQENSLKNNLVGAEVTFDKNDTTMNPKDELIETVEALDNYLQTKDNTEDIIDEMFTESQNIDDTIFESTVTSDEIVIELDYKDELNS